MEYTNLGRTGLSVSRLCLGTMNFGPMTSEADSFAVMDKALELGINFIDTANVYGQKKGEGVTEQIIGRWLAQGGRRRERIVLATKVFGTMGDWPNERALSALHIRRACDESLRRLQTDRIDLYQMHHVERSTPWEEIWQAMEQLVQAGKVLYVGSSNFAAWNIVQANEAAKRRNFMGLVSDQSLYNLTTRAIELELLPACRAYGVGVIPYSPVAGGALCGAPKGTEKTRRTSDMIRARFEKFHDQLKKYEALCRKIGRKPAVVALSWLLAQPGVTAPITGPRTVDQLVESTDAVKHKLDAETLKKLDEIWPGPGNQAPEAYAW